MNNSGDIEYLVSRCKAEPRQSCPIVDAAQRECRSIAKRLDLAARDTEPGMVNDILNDAETLAGEIESTLEVLRGIAGDLRDRCEGLEKAAEKAVESMVAYEERIAELETHQKADHDIIEHLTARIRRSWWGRLLDHAQGLFWKRRAQATAKKNAALRREVCDAKEYASDCTQVVLQALDYFNEAEWSRTANQEWCCSECGVTWASRWSVTPPEHDENCQIGTIARRLRWAVQGTQESA